MSLFDAEIFDSEEEVSSEVLLLPKNTEAVGKVVSSNVMVKYRDENHEKSPNTVWVGCNLRITVHGKNEDFKDLINAEEVTLNYQVRCRTKANGLPETVGNPYFGQFCETFGVKSAVKDLTQNFDEISMDDYDTETAYNVARVKKWWENFATQFVSKDVDAIIGVQKGTEAYPGDSNIISKILPRQYD